MLGMSQSLPKTLAVMTAWFCLACCARLDAALIIGDIGGGNLTASGYSVGPGGGLNNAIAEGFTMTQSMTLTSVDLILSNFQDGAGSNLQLSIYNSVAGQPTVDIYDLSPTTPLPASGTPTLVNFTGTGPLVLLAGTQYWLNFYATNPASGTGQFISWVGAQTASSTQTNPSGPSATDNGQKRSVSAGNPPTGAPSFSELRTAFQINGELVAVPEPSTVCLSLICASGLGLTSYRRKR